MILDEITERTRERVAESKAKTPLCDVIAAAKERGNSTRSFYKALAEGDISFICEVKRSSPSAGMIAQEFDFEAIAEEYEKAGAAAVSVLTEPYYFKGSLDFLQKISDRLTIPVLRKDFTVDEYMIYEARAYGADAVLLICSILSDEQIKEYLEITHSLGMSALVEAHTSDEVLRAAACGAKIIGVNNRNLKDFTVNIENSLSLLPFVPSNAVFVSESGMKTAEDIQRLREKGVNAVLIGETLMRADDKAQMIKTLRGC